MENEVLKSPSEFDVSSAIKKWRSQGFSKEMIELARNDMAEYGMPFKQVSIYMDVKLSAGQAEQLSQALRNEVNEDFVRHAKHYDRVERTVRERYQKVKQSPDKNVVRTHSEVRRR